MSKRKIKCKYCAEEILADAIKCKHCGEWIKSPPPSVDDASSVAKAVAKGIKKKELDQNTVGCLGVIALVASVSIGVWLNGTVGWIVFIVCMVLITKSYYKE